MTRSQLVTLANLIREIQPEWSQSGILKFLGQLSEAWKGTYAEFAEYAAGIAGDPESKTPAALMARPLPQPKPAAQPKGPKCFICGGTSEQCARRHAFEVRRGVPDPHQFKTAEEAERNASRRQLRVPRATHPDRIPWLPDEVLKQAEDANAVDATPTPSPIN